MTTSDHDPVDPELVTLVAALCDETLGEKDRLRLEHLLRTNPAALRYCADRIQFESELNEVASPPRDLQWSETKRLVRSGTKGWELRFEQALRFGGRDNPDTAASLSKTKSARWMKWLALVVSLAALAAAGWRAHRFFNQLVLKNGDFEIDTLAFSSSSEMSSISDWRDYFANPNTTLVDISKSTGGKVFAHSGRNVVKMPPGGFITQKLLRRNGSPLTAKPGKKLRFSGWARIAPGSPPASFTAGLRFFASGYPKMFQYEPTVATIPAPTGDWQHFSIDLTLPDDLVTGRVTMADDMERPPKLDLTDRPLTFSIDNRAKEQKRPGNTSPSGGTLLLDDLKLEELDPGK